MVTTYGTSWHRDCPTGSGWRFRNTTLPPEGLLPDEVVGPALLCDIRSAEVCVEPTSVSVLCTAAG